MKTPLLLQSTFTLGTESIPHSEKVKYLFPIKADINVT